MHILFGMFKSGVNSLTSAEVIAESMGRPLAHHSLLSPTSPIEDYVPPLSPEHTHGMCDQADMFDRETELNLPCYILMLDLILKQVGLLKEDCKTTYVRTIHRTVYWNIAAVK